MAQIILDFGSGNTCKNDKLYIKHMIDELKAVDSGKQELIIKWQLWSLTNPQGNNLHLNWGNFEYAYYYAKELGYKTTASVFDKPSLDYLLQYDIPFVKIACNPKLHFLIDEVPRKIPVYVSYNDAPVLGYNLINLYCIPEYPANFHLYVKHDELGNLIKTADHLNISDHTTDLRLFNSLNPQIIEMHYALKDSTGLDAESKVCKTPEMLKEIL